MNYKPYIIIIASAIAFQAFAFEDSLIHVFSHTAALSPVARALAGAGTAMPEGGFQGLANPALTVVSGAGGDMAGSFSAGYGRDRTFDKLALPFGAVVTENTGALGLYYRYLSGGRGRVHDAAVNFAGRLAERTDQQGPVEFGMNVRYEDTDWRHEIAAGDNGLPPREAGVRSRNILLDIGFYQPAVYPGLDFSLVIMNLTGYRWSEIDGEESEDWFRGRYRTLTAGLLYTIPLLGDNLVFRVPFDLEIANLFEKELPNKYIARMGLDTRILQVCSVRFGYANAPENPLDLFSDFDYGNLFYGGIGVFVKQFQVDFFAGKDEFGITATYRY
jgi:hypothetical protein